MILENIALSALVGAGSLLLLISWLLLEFLVKEIGVAPADILVAWRVGEKASGGWF